MKTVLGRPAHQVWHVPASLVAIFDIFWCYDHHLGCWQEEKVKIYRKCEENNRQQTHAEKKQSHQNICFASQNMERLEWCIPVRSPVYLPYSPLKQKYAPAFIAGNKAKHCCSLRKAGSTFVLLLVWKWHPPLIKLHFLHLFFLFFWFLWGKLAAVGGPGVVTTKMIPIGYGIQCTLLKMLCIGASFLKYPFNISMKGVERRLFEAERCCKRIQRAT